MKTITVTVALALAFALSGAEGVEGTIGGDQWSLVSVHESPFPNEDQDVIDINLYAEVVDPAFPRSSLPSVMLTLPLEPGAYQLDNAYTATFYTPPDINLTTNEGVLVVEQGDAGGEMVVTLTVRYDDANQISGVFRYTPKGE